jgi:biopolymer transport protein ExbB
MTQMGYKDGAERMLQMKRFGVLQHRRWVPALLAIGLILPVPAVAQAPQAAPPAATAPMSPASQATPTSPTTPQPAPESPAPQAAPAIAPAESTAPAASPDMVLKLPRDLSPWGMFMAADLVVKAVMIGLAFASVLTWTIWFAKAIELMAARARMRKALDALDQARSWSEASKAVRGGSAGSMIAATDAELSLSADALSPDGVKERIVSRLERLEAAAGRQMIRGTGILATIGATAPFVGLFGTVWGIMNSFIGISKAHTTNLAVVAPGIAEALLATALGLVAAIPAVVMYNMFSRWTAAYRAQHADASAAILRIVSRDLDRGAFQRGRRPVAAE